MVHMVARSTCGGGRPKSSDSGRASILAWRSFTTPRGHCPEARVRLGALEMAGHDGRRSGGSGGRRRARRS
jgi:hypothetical protein